MELEQALRHLDRLLREAPAYLVGAQIVTMSECLEPIDYEFALAMRNLTYVAIRKYKRAYFDFVRDMAGLENR